MKLLLDTHIVFWALMQPVRLPQRARSLLESHGSEAFVSLASAWEIALKVGIGKWPEAEELLRQFEGIIDDAGFDILSCTVGQVRAAGLMRVPHRDPFDRLLAAQALDLDLALVTVDPVFAAFGCRLA